MEAAILNNEDIHIDKSADQYMNFNIKFNNYIRMQSKGILFIYKG